MALFTTEMGSMAVMDMKVIFPHTCTTFSRTDEEATEKERCAASHRKTSVGRLRTLRTTGVYGLQPRGPLPAWTASSHSSVTTTTTMEQKDLRTSATKQQSPKSKQGKELDKVRK